MFKGVKVDINKIVMLVVILLVVGLIIWGVYNWGKSKTEPTIKDLPNKVTGNLSDSEVKELSALAKNLKNDMDDSVFSNNENLYYQASILTDRKLLGLSNIFNSYYEVESGETLKQWIESESFTSIFNDIDSYADTIVNRLMDLSVS
jgi:hypothetical protein